MLGAQGHSMRPGGFSVRRRQRYSYYKEMGEIDPETDTRTHTRSVLNDLREPVLLYCFLN